MGLFSFLKKKEPEPAPAITATIHAQTVEVKQRTHGELPLAEIGGYVSPSGGFVNYGRFCVRYELQHREKEHEAIRGADRG